MSIKRKGGHFSDLVFIVKSKPGVDIIHFESLYRLYHLRSHVQIRFCLAFVCFVVV